MNISLFLLWFHFNCTSSLMFNEKTSLVCFVHSCRHSMETSKYYYWGKKSEGPGICWQTHYLFFFSSMVLRFWTICVINTGFYSLSKCLLFGLQVHLRPVRLPVLCIRWMWLGDEFLWGKWHQEIYRWESCRQSTGKAHALAKTFVTFNIFKSKSKYQWFIFFTEAFNSISYSHSTRCRCWAYTSFHIYLF